MQESAFGLSKDLHLDLAKTFICSDQLGVSQPSCKNVHVSHYNTNNNVLWGT